MGMELASLEMPEGARVTPGYGPGQFLVRFANDYGASLIHDLRGNGLELGVIRYTGADPHEWEFVSETSVSPYDSIVPGVDTPEELLGYLAEIAGWEKPREEFTEGELRFVWVSGAYIDVYWVGHDESPFTCIGIYDYAAGECEITDRDGFIAKCQEWAREANTAEDGGETEVENYRRHTLPPYR